ncbi:DNA-directed RNA polymerase I subunit rpa49 [Elasticomyces elasticus]|uniref:DNA-directed RNA polymerase I subunit rpa49 n=1 Tax=Exophiala sideris TaxID=1016849 RepID=A0ABR0J8J7_9EURO|nr:DNA-directed RNA polymerase I subunit rpa49 [Elasticomyces elasticus]KAK5029377.1 DNA-directed RNA polymerase I subunit rpa49 [Exophiala sideris]KAK5036925.1 DNA-directed RNA polymerase I subunit rpa49 [Exophiala sideris]KAK5058007.1 DNA-directed RNA polymerase I subunit rpa49 [Exophiala sideris]KAK5181966.1 DNA-directed RNA polymerase I subunit rpa49 [Eurotiomycetes sp. CCFEE 6388]
MAEKKRKAAAPEGERPAKKPQTSKVKVTHLSSADIAKPVVASSPGFNLPPSVSFNAFSKKSSTQSTLLLQSSTHPTIDYLATESSTTDVADKHVKHYIAVFDPATSHLKVLPAKKMTVRSSVRQPAQDNSDSEAEATQPTPSSRAALTEAFGTKKSKKAVASMAENRLLARGGAGDATHDALSSAILSSIKDEGDVDELDQATSRANKPLPQADLSATDITQVYPFSSLIFPGPARTTLSQMPIAYWRDRIGSAKPVNSRYRFIAHRVESLTKPHIDNPADKTYLTNLQVLRYIQLLLEIYTYIARLPNRRPIPDPEKWPAKTTSDASLSTTFLSKLISHFFPTSQPMQQAKTLLVTTILALTLHVPPPKFHAGQELPALITEPSDISLDLALQPTEVNKYYRELGCKIDSLTDAELTRYGWEKAGKARKVVDASGKEVSLPKPKFAKLRFPIEFPKVSAGRPSARR